MWKYAFKYGVDITHMERLIELEKIIKEKDKLQWADPDVMELNRIIEEYSPFNIDQLIRYTKAMKEDYTRWAEEEIANAKKELFDTKQKLTEIAQLVLPYLPKGDE